MKKYLPIIVSLTTIFLILLAIFYSGINYGKTHPDELISPLPIDKNCIQLNIEVNPDQSGNIERNNKNEKPSPTGKPIPSPSAKSDSPSTVRQSDNPVVTASYYTTEYCERFNPSCLTASGEVFNDYDLTAACDNSIKLGTKVQLTSENGSVTVKCNDRGSFSEKYGRMFDLSKAAFIKLSPLSKGVVTVAYKIVD
jgi:rare lipoprotein A (peptidoglycan hydrolase)